MRPFLWWWIEVSIRLVSEGLHPLVVAVGQASTAVTARKSLFVAGLAVGTDNVVPLELVVLDGTTGAVDTFFVQGSSTVGTLFAVVGRETFGATNAAVPRFVERLSFDDSHVWPPVNER